MDKILQPQFKGRLAYVLGIAAWIAYAVISLFAPRGGNTYHINPVNFVIIQISIILPVFFIWMTAIYGAVNFRAYSALIEESRDGAALKKIAIGLYLLTTSFIVQTLFSVLRRLTKDTPALNVMVFCHNHIPVILALIAVINIFIGTRRLLNLVDAKVRPAEMLLGLSVFAAATAWLAPYLYNHISHSVIDGIPNFILPGHWPFFTIALPYIVAWLFSILSIINIVTYTRNVKGSIYRAGLKYVVTGIMFVVTLAVGVQMLTFLANALQKLSLNTVLIIVYLMLIIYAVGYWLVAVGARKLSRIEVVQ